MRPRWAVGLRDGGSFGPGPLKEVPATVDGVEIAHGKVGTLHPLVWAAFTLSGPGR